MYTNAITSIDAIARGKTLDPRTHQMDKIGVVGVGGTAQHSDYALTMHSSSMPRVCAMQRNEARGAMYVGALMSNGADARMIEAQLWRHKRLILDGARLFAERQVADDTSRWHNLKYN